MTIFKAGSRVVCATNIIAYWDTGKLHEHLYDIRVGGIYEVVHPSQTNELLCYIQWSDTVRKAFPKDLFLSGSAVGYYAGKEVYQKLQAEGSILLTCDTDPSYVGFKEDGIYAVVKSTWDDWLHGLADNVAVILEGELNWVPGETFKTGSVDRREPAEIISVY